MQNSDNNFTLAIYQAQEELSGHRPVFEMPIQIKLNFTNGDDTTVSVWNNLQTQNFSFNLNDEISSVEFDPDKWILQYAEYKPGLPVGIVDPENAGSINLYPNPFHNKLVVFCNQNKYGSAIQYSVYNVNGQLIESSTIKVGNQLVIKTSHYPAGLYYFHIAEKGKEGIWQKVIKY